jgi:hypothetical protein
MNRITIRLLALAVLLTSGFTAMNAQNFRGNQFGRNMRGACINSSGLTVEQRASLQKLSATHQAEMDALRVEFRSASNLADRKTIRAKMDQVQAGHRAKVIRLGAYTPNTPRSGYYGRGWGRGAGRGMGPCGAFRPQG